MHITSLKPTSLFDAQKKQWQSTIDLEITSNAEFNAEYTAKLKLPEGCWINDYYLYVGNKKEKGILAEKKTAQWLYNMVTATNRDPGILYYTGRNSVEFKVFPFVKKEVRKTGISFLHKEPVVIEIAGQKVQLGSGAPGQISTDKGYISAIAKAGLKKITRKPYYHFVVDASEGKANMQVLFLKMIDKFLKENSMPDMVQPKYSLANTYTVSLAEGKSLNKQGADIKYEGGFFADMAIRKILYKSYTDNKEEYPIIVIVTNNAEDIITGDDFSELKFAFPENEVYYQLLKGGIKSRSLVNDSYDNDASVVADPKQVIVWSSVNGKKHYLRNDSLAEVVPQDKFFVVEDSKVKKDDWETALVLQQELMAKALHPETANDNWVSQIRHSFASGVMTPLTSYMVVENEAQKALLLKKQKQVLSGPKSLDLGENEQRMSEPGLLVMAGLVILAMILRRMILNRRKIEAA